jgi:hypothetical protein
MTDGSEDESIAPEPTTTAVTECLTFPNALQGHLSVQGTLRRHLRVERSGATTSLPLQLSSQGV